MRAAIAGLLGILVSFSAFAQAPSISPPYTTLSQSIVPFTDAGVAGDNTTDDTAALVTALQNAATSNYKLVGSPGLIFKITSPITLPSDADVDWNGASINCTAVAGQCVTISPYLTSTTTYTGNTRPGQSGLVVY